AQEGLVKAQSRLIGLLEDHSALKDELSKSKSNPQQQQQQQQQQLAQGGSKKGLNAFVRVRRGLEGLLSAGIMVVWRLMKPGIRHRKVVCYHCCAIGKSAHLAKDCPNEVASYKCGLKGHEDRACPGGPPR
ncbi:hypothetical protein FOZ63_013458, partial [Perkinsus olseni]